MYLTNKRVRAFKPCYDPIKYYKNNEKYTLIDVLKNKKIPIKDRLWVIVRKELLTLNQLKYYSLACAKLSLKYTNDKSVKDCVKITEKYLKGKASKYELEKAKFIAICTAKSTFAKFIAIFTANSASATSNNSIVWSLVRNASMNQIAEKQCKALIKIIK